MSVNTKIKDGFIETFEFPVTVWDLDDKSWHHNPSIARDSEGKIWCSTRYHKEEPAIRYANPEPYSHPTSWLMLGVLNEKTLKVSGVKRIKPHPKSPKFLLEKEVEDIRIFWRKDGLHGIGVCINAFDFYGETRVYQVEILIDYKTGYYKLIRDYGYIKGHMEKNWTPPSVWTKYFDYIYSPSEIVLENKVYGREYGGITHGGSQALPYKNGWIRIAHQVVSVSGVTHRWYASIAERMNSRGFVTHQSQFFDLCTGWRPQIRESVEFVSGAVWTKKDKELLLSYGVRDETCGFVKIPVDMFEWEPFEEALYYNWKFSCGEPPITPDLWIGEKFSGSVYSLV